MKAEFHCKIILYIVLIAIINTIYSIQKESKMLYKIESIKHSRGTLKGLDRQDDRYPMRIGRIISLDIDDILIDFPLIIKYVRDSDGTPMRNLVLRTSFVKSFEYIKDENGVINWINIVTENSIYKFKRVDDE